MSEFYFGINLAISVYSAALLIFLFIAEKRRSTERIDHPERQKLFIIFLVLLFITIVCDFLSRLDGRPGFISTVCRMSNMALFILNPALVLCWFLYVCEQIGVERNTHSVGIAAEAALFSANAMCVIATQFTGWIYYFTCDGVYHRGPLFYITGFTMAVMVVLSEFLLVKHKSEFERTHYWALLFFPVIPFAASIVQSFFYGIAFALNCTAFSILIVFFYVQNRHMDIDYLTGVYNRRKLDMFLQQHIDSASAEKSFSAILIDIDDFKHINDTLGHNAGDTALEDATDVLRGCMRSGTFISRYGGDEFCIVLDVDSKEILGRIMERIRHAVKSFNRKSGKTYELGFSMGGDVYDGASGMKLGDYLAHIDFLMYEDKSRRASTGAGVRTAPKRRSTDREIR